MLHVLVYLCPSDLEAAHVVGAYGDEEEAEEAAYYDAFDLVGDEREPLRRQDDSRGFTLWRMADDGGAWVLTYRCDVVPVPDGFLIPLWPVDVDA